jgi:hypothetical protein
MFLEIQDQYDISVDEDDVPSLQRVGDLASYVGPAAPAGGGMSGRAPSGVTDAWEGGERCSAGG